MHVTSQSSESQTFEETPKARTCFFGPDPTDFSKTRIVKPGKSLHVMAVIIPSHDASQITGPEPAELLT
jgi:hypothetical protein